MAKDNDVYNYEQKDKVTKVGKFIRKKPLGELPQLINILKGEMSFISSRPWISDVIIISLLFKKRNLLKLS